MVSFFDSIAKMHDAVCDMGTASIVEVEAARLRTSGNAFIPGAVHNPFDPIRLIFVKSFNAHLEWGRELSVQADEAFNLRLARKFSDELLGAMGVRREYSLSLLAAKMEKP